MLFGLAIVCTSAGEHAELDEMEGTYRDHGQSLLTPGAANAWCHVQQLHARDISLHYLLC
jgi:hypothetical protein